MRGGARRVGASPYTLGALSHRKRGRIVLMPMGTVGGRVRQGQTRSGARREVGPRSPGRAARVGMLVATLAAFVAVGGSALAAAGWDETPGGVAHTWSDYTTASGRAGPVIADHQTVSVMCRVRGFKVPDGNVWWYRVGSKPWDGRFYVSADAFYNDGRRSGSLRGTPFFDQRVAMCRSSS